MPKECKIRKDDDGNYVQHCRTDLIQGLNTPDNPPEFWKTGFPEWRWERWKNESDPNKPMRIWMPVDEVLSNDAVLTWVQGKVAKVDILWSVRLPKKNFVWVWIPTVLDFGRLMLAQALVEDGLYTESKGREYFVDFVNDVMMGDLTRPIKSLAEKYKLRRWW